MTLLKICGLRQPAQAAAVAEFGVDAIGVIAVEHSPRFLAPPQRKPLFSEVAAVAPPCLGVLVVADPPDSEMPWLAASQGHRVIQLHGGETPERCVQLRQRLEPELLFWKALRIRRPEDLARAWDYAPVVDALLLDAWVPDQLGGTGHRIPVEWLEGFRPPIPWWLAGGITAERVPELLRRLDPDGLDASSSVEDAPGDKNLPRVRQLVEVVRGGASARPG